MIIVSDGGVCYGTQHADRDLSAVVDTDGADRFSKAMGGPALLWFLLGFEVLNREFVVTR